MIGVREGHSEEVPFELRPELEKGPVRQRSGGRAARVEGTIIRKTLRRK